MWIPERFSVGLSLLGATKCRSSNSLCNGVLLNLGVNYLVNGGPPGVHGKTIPSNKGDNTSHSETEEPCVPGRNLYK